MLSLLFTSSSICDRVHQNQMKVAQRVIRRMLLQSLGLNHLLRKPHQRKVKNKTFFLGAVVKPCLNDWSFQYCYFIKTFNIAFIVSSNQRQSLLGLGGLHVACYRYSCASVITVKHVQVMLSFSCVFFSALLGLSSAMKAGFNREDTWTSRV